MGEGKWGSTVGGPKAATSTSNAKTAAAASRNKQQEKQQQAATSSRIRSSTKLHKQQPGNSEGQEVWVPKWEEGVFPWNFVRLCSRLFFLDTSKICNNWSLIFSEVSWEGERAHQF